MRKIAFVFACLFCLICNAQEHLSYKGISFETSLDDFCNRLKTECGLTPSKLTKLEKGENYENRKLTGDFFGIKKCTFYVNRHIKANIVTSLSVVDTVSVISNEVIQKIVKSCDEEYGEHKVDSTTLICYKWDVDGGDIRFILYDKGFSLYLTDKLEIQIRDEEFEKWKIRRERQTVTEICSVPFGSSREKAEEILENKYGTSSYLSDKDKIIYNYKNYAGIAFDEIIFLFQSDGFNSFFNGCVFILDAKNLTQAKEKRDLLYNKLRYKYDMKSGTDKNGIKYYIGGYSPVFRYDSAFVIDIIKYDNNPNTPYAARLMYGRYNYVKEEF